MPLARMSFWFGAGLMLCYVPGVTGTSILTGWPYLAATLPFFLFKKTSFTLLHALGIAFLSYVILSLAWTDNIFDGLGAVAIWLILGMGFYYGTVVEDDWRDLYFGICCGLAVSVLISVSQAAGFDPFPIGDFRSNPSGLFVNSTVFGSVLCLSLILAVFSGLWWYLPIGGLGLFLSGARAAGIAFILVLLVGVWKWDRRLVLILAVPAILFCTAVWLNKPLDDARSSLRLRAAYWADTGEALTVRGSGVGSFFQLYPEFAKRTDVVKSRPEHPYSDFLELLFEFGIGTLPLWALLILAWEVPLVPERLVLLAFAILGLTYFPLAVPASAFLVAFAAGRLAWGWSVVRRGGDLGRPFIPYWIGTEGPWAGSVRGGIISIQSNTQN